MLVVRDTSFIGILLCKPFQLGVEEGCVHPGTGADRRRGGGFHLCPGHQTGVFDARGHYIAGDGLPFVSVIVLSGWQDFLTAVVRGK